uniref:Uncharacterized protein n=1 Tax=Cyprinus carpio TaxID=7962 RepID=A0A8C2BIU5_CYPCA
MKLNRAKLKKMGITHILNTMNITYYSVLVMDKHRFDISNDLFPASEFIHKMVSAAPAHFFLAYLMIHHEILLEDAIDHVIDMRWIRPNRDFLKQLTILNSNLKSQQINRAKKKKKQQQQQQQQQQQKQTNK